MDSDSNPQATCANECRTERTACMTDHGVDGSDDQVGTKDVCSYDGCCNPRKDIPKPSVLRVLVAELLGTCMIVLVGCGSVCSGLSGAYVGIWQTAVVWGIGVTLAILCTAEISGAHLNPAVTIAFWLVRNKAHNMRFTKVAMYITAQLLGGILGGALNLLFYSGTINAFERSMGIVRGDELSILSAMAFGQYFPNPGLTIEYGGEPYLLSDVTPAQAVLVEGWGTFILCAVIFAVTHEHNPVLDVSGTRTAVPAVIGATISMLLALYAPITQAGWNPARDFGPRIVAYAGGWGSVAIPGPRNGFWVYIVGSLVGGPLGAAFMEFIVLGTIIDKGWNRMLKKGEHSL